MFWCDFYTSITFLCVSIWIDPLFHLPFRNLMFDCSLQFIIGLSHFNLYFSYFLSNWINFHIFMCYLNWLPCKLSMIILIYFPLFSVSRFLSIIINCPFIRMLHCRCFSRALVHAIMFFLIFVWLNYYTFITSEFPGMDKNSHWKSRLDIWPSKFFWKAFFYT